MESKAIAIKRANCGCRRNCPVGASRKLASRM